MVASQVVVCHIKLSRVNSHRIQIRVDLRCVNICVDLRHIALICIAPLQRNNNTTLQCNNHTTLQRNNHPILQHKNQNCNVVVDLLDLDLKLLTRG
jgi:hypothetical protein